MVEVHRVLPRGGAGTFTTAEALAILKVAFLAGEADGKVADEEQTSFGAFARALRDLAEPQSNAMSDDALDAALEQFERTSSKLGVKKALASIRADLARPLARDTAYKSAVAMTLADMDRSDAESDFDDDLVEALGLSEDDASTLAQDVYAALEKD